MKGGSQKNLNGTDFCSGCWGRPPVAGAKASPLAPTIYYRPVLPRMMIAFLLVLSLAFFLYTLRFVPSKYSSCAIDGAFLRISSSSHDNSSTSGIEVGLPSTELRHLVFGIAGSSRHWEKRKEYIKIWWRPGQTLGFVWLDKPVDGEKYNNSSSAATAGELPVIKISSDTRRFPYTNKQGNRAAIRLSRIVSETLRSGVPDEIRWFVMGDDDTVFFPDNIVRVLLRFDHRQPYYIGSVSESHMQNIYFSYSMAYGGGGFAISRPLAESLAGMQDRCLHRYPALYGSDDRIQACMAELGVPLTRHQGFHQYDVYGDLLGLLSAHPVAPLVSVHHLDVVQPIFPNVSRAAALRRLFDGPVKLDSAGVMQQSICYDARRHWTISVAWGFVSQVIRGVVSPREMETPTRTFLNWYRRADYTAYAFNTRPVARNPCQKPYVYYLNSSRYDSRLRTTITVYDLHSEERKPCRWKIEDPSTSVRRIVIYKKPDPHLWDRSPRRNCCRVLTVKGRRGEEEEETTTTMAIDVGVCRDGELSEI